MDRIDYVRETLKYQRNILKVFSQATAAQIADGKAWYPTATATLAELAPAWNLQHRAAVCAILSPRITWKENIKAVRKMYRAVSEHQSLVPTIAGVRRNVFKAWDVANDGEVSRVSGPKVSAFYANLQGNLQRVTVDVWAARAAGLAEVPGGSPRGERYKALEAAYQAVAAQLFFQPAELQAIVWIVIRGSGE